MSFTPLSEYATMALERKEVLKQIYCVWSGVDEACTSCVDINYEVSNLLSWLW